MKLFLRTKCLCHQCSFYARFFATLLPSVSVPLWEGEAQACFPNSSWKSSQCSYMNVKELLLINFNELFIFIAFKVWTVKWEIWITGNKWKNIPQKQRKTRERQWGGEGALRRHTKKQNHGYRTRDLQQLSYIWQIYHMLLQSLLLTTCYLACQFFCWRCYHTVGDWRDVLQAEEANRVSTGRYLGIVERKINFWSKEEKRGHMNVFH